MEATQLLLISIPTLLVFMTALYVAWQFHKNRQCLETWAKENGYQLIAATDCFDGQPSDWSPRTGASYEITVRDAQGKERQGWVHNGYPFAEECHKIKVAWKEG